ncbi:MAG: zinc-ribbon domain-containing protein [Candidatus Fimenecus sp.]
MKYCSKCGEVMNDSAKFCAKCGHPAPQPQKTSIGAQTPVSADCGQAKNANPVNTYPNITAQVNKELLPDTDNHKKTVLVSIVLQIATLIMWFVPVLTVSSVFRMTVGDESTYKTSDSTIALYQCWEDVTLGLIISIVIIVISILLTALPILRKSLNKRHRFILPKLSAIYSALMFALVLVSGIDTVSKYSEYGAVCQLTAGGYAFIICALSSIVLLFVASHQSKVISKRVA